MKYVCTVHVYTIHIEVYDGYLFEYTSLNYTKHPF